jgi:hypothetical protein
MENLTYFLEYFTFLFQGSRRHQRRSPVHGHRRLTGDLSQRLRHQGSCALQPDADAKIEGIQAPRFIGIPAVKCYNQYLRRKIIMKTLPLLILLSLVLAPELSAQGLKLGMTLDEAKAVIGKPTSESKTDGYYEWKSVKILGFENSLVKVNLFEGKIYTFTYSFSDETAPTPILKGLVEKYGSYKLTSNLQDSIFVQKDKKNDPIVKIIFHQYQKSITLTYLDINLDIQKRKADEEAEKARQPKVDAGEL